jgi:hypothetical protein
VHSNLLTRSRWPNDLAKQSGWKAQRSVIERRTSLTNYFCKTQNRLAKFALNSFWSSKRRGWSAFGLPATFENRDTNKKILILCLQKQGKRRFTTWWENSSTFSLLMIFLCFYEKNAKVSGIVEEKKPLWDVFLTLDHLWAIYCMTDLSVNEFQHFLSRFCSNLNMHLTK